MEPIKYPYSTILTCFHAIWLFAFFIFSIFLSIDLSDPGNKVFIPDIFITLILGALIVYFFIKIILPLIQGKSALELDKEKLQYFIFNKTIYWKDVENIIYADRTNGSWLISFIMKDGSNDIKIQTRYIAGKNKEIYNSILQCFEKNK